MNAAIPAPARDRLALKGADAVEFQPMIASVTLMLRKSSPFRFQSLPEPDA